MTTRGAARRGSAYYWAPVQEFLCTDPDAVLGALTRGDGFTIEEAQCLAWEEEAVVLRGALAGITGTIFLEFHVPRLGSRIDAVLVTGPAVFPIEFKCGERKFLPADYEQAWDYALDLKNFHKGSHEAGIFPVLIATAARAADDAWKDPHADGTRPPRRCRPGDLRPAIDEGLAVAVGELLDGEAWGSAPYEPTPTIIEAARVLYARHTVDDISRNDARAKNVSVTSGAVEEVIERARADRHKAIVFLTGVPGGGKTLVGLNVATRRREMGEARAVFLSGNGPLVAVLQEALTRDELERCGHGVRKGKVRQKVKPFIQNVHHFRDDGVRDLDAPPYAHVVIFDEAQRAWNKAKTADFMKRRKKLPNFSQSEPEFLISYLDRHREWAVIICLVGGGQEIHTGEAGIGAWLDALHDAYAHWQIYLAPNLAGSEHAAGEALGALENERRVGRDDRFHLTTSMRSFRSERVSEFVKAVLDCDVDRARRLHAEFSGRYPIAITRDLTRAKAWVRSHARGSERSGMVASSQAQRLKPHAIDVRVNVNPIHWFLNERNDTRSSYYLEDAATEFQVQGLELDWICVNWDADLRRDRTGWHHHEFRGKTWNVIRKEQRQRYLLNAYRVLLTRARQGMVIFVPPGEPLDPTRRPSYYDRTYEYLAGLRLPEA